MEGKLYYLLGQRDTLAQVLAMGRLKANQEGFGPELMKEIAEILLRIDPEHVHAKWWKERPLEGC